MDTPTIPTPIISACRKCGGLRRDFGEGLSYEEHTGYCYQEEELARALFETDSRIKDFVYKVSDHNMRGDGDKYEMDVRRILNAMQAAWDCNEQGWRKEAEQRASDMMSVIRKGYV